MSVDRAKALSFDCNKCDKASQRLRNCNGRGKDAVNLLNQSIYTQCPKALWLIDPSARELFHLYIECREMRAWPDTGGILDQTAFTIDLFKYLDGIISEHRIKKMSEQDELLKKNASKK